MAPKGPITLCEWMTGTTIPSALGPILEERERPRQRNVVKVDVTTDDESEEDSVRITYPRTGRPALAKEDLESVVKTVRFLDSPRKSAMKKPASVSTIDEGSLTDSEGPEVSDSAASTTSDEPVDSSGSEKRNDFKKSKKKNKKVRIALVDSDGESSSSFDVVSTPSSAESESASDVDSKAHPTCECGDCTRARIRSNKQEKASKSKKSKKFQKSCEDSQAQDTSGSESDDECSAPEPARSKSSNTKGTSAKQKPENGNKVAEEQVKTNNKKDNKGNKKDENAKKHKADATKLKKAKPEKKQKQKSKQQQDDKAGKKEDIGKSSETSGESEPEEVDKSVKGKSTKGRKSVSKKGSKLATYPEANPSPHHRRPHLIEPIRAEVVQTERVIETPEDPMPNAYYDSTNNVIRVYHGPVYGRHGQQSLYPKRDPSQRPLPIGMPHPSQNPYFNGFYGQEWNMNRPLGQPPDLPGAFVQPRRPVIDPDIPAPAANQNDGDYSGGPPSSTRGRDGLSNVGPGDVKSILDNPYIPKSIRSQFSTYGSNSQRSGSGSHRGVDNAGWPKGDDIGGVRSPDARHRRSWNRQDDSSWKQADAENETQQDQYGGNNGNSSANGQEIWKAPGVRADDWNTSASNAYHDVGDSNDRRQGWGDNQNSHDDNGNNQPSWNNPGRNAVDSSWNNNNNNNNVGHTNGTFATHKFEASANGEHSGYYTNNNGEGSWNNTATNDGGQWPTGTQPRSPPSGDTSNVFPVPGAWNVGEEVSQEWGGQDLAVDTQGKHNMW